MVEIEVIRQGFAYYGALCLSALLAMTLQSLPMPRWKLHAEIMTLLSFHTSPAGYPYFDDGGLKKRGVSSKC